MSTLIRNNVDRNQTAPKEQSDLGLHYHLRFSVQICGNTVVTGFRKITHRNTRPCAINLKKTQGIRLHFIGDLN